MHDGVEVVRPSGDVMSKIERVSWPAGALGEPAMGARNRYAALAVTFAVAIAILALGSSLTPATAQEARHRVQGVLTNADGEPLRGQRVFLTGSGDSRGKSGSGVTLADGTFGVVVPEGTYYIDIQRTLGSECTVTGYENPASPSQVSIAVQGGDIAGVGLTVSGTPGGTEPYMRCAFPAETLGHIQGTVVDAEGQPVEGVWITGNVYAGSEGVYDGVFTASDGTFHLRLRHGVYLLHIHWDRADECTVSGYERPGAIGQAIFDTKDGNVAGLQVTASGAASASRVWSVCLFDTPLPRILGTVRDSDGEPLDGVNVRAFGEPGEASFGPWTGSTNAAGNYEVEVLHGAYVLEFHVMLPGGECRLGYTGSGGGHTLLVPFDRRVAITDEDQTGVDIQLPATVAELCRPISGRVTDSRGSPLQAAIAFDGLGPLLGTRANSALEADGTFTLYAQAGTYRLLVATMGGSECTVAGAADAQPGQLARIDVGEQGIADVHAVVSGTPGTEYKRFYCSVPPEMITTELQPGWNLGGWTGKEDTIAALFEAIPALEIVYAWDVEGQRFRSAIEGGRGVLGDLTTLRSGMGLWLYVGGTEPVQWTRAYQPESRLVSVSGGWNLVAWSGEDGIIAEEAFATLGGDFAGAAAWDTRVGGFLEYELGAPETGSPQSIGRGQGLWVRASTGRYWLQPGSVQLPITYTVGVSDTTKAEFPPAVEAVLTSFAERYGVFLPSISYRIDSSIRYCGFYQNRGVYLREACLRAVAHEYVHAIQDHLNESGGRNPAWITEGMANRWSALYYDITGDRAYEDHIQDITRPNARLTPLPLEEMEGTLSVEHFTNPNYSVAHLAADWLVTLTGEDRFLDYYRNRSSYNTWEEAFEATFAIGVADFYESFEKHRREVAPLRVSTTIQGTVVGPDDQPLADVRVFGEPESADGIGWSTTTADDGTFEFPAANGEYLISLTDFSLTEDCHFGWYAGDGSLASRRGQALAVTVGGADPGEILIRLAGDPSELASELCSRVEGVIVGPEGEPVAGVHVLLVRHDDRLTEGFTTEADGTFAVVAPSGFYWFALYHGNCHIGWYGGGGRLATPGRELLLNVTVGKDITGIEIRLPAPVSDLCQ